MIFAIVIYAVLHDVTNLQIFKNLKNTALIEWYKGFQQMSLQFLKRLPFFKFIKNHLVDILWFLSFSLVFTALLPLSKKIQFLLLLLMAFMSEFSQALFPALGTFDILDLLSYIVIAIFFI